MTNLSLNLTEAAAMYPDSVAVRCDDYTLSFAELDAAAARLATFLETEGVRAGDSVGLMLGNIPAFAVVYYGILRIGAVVVPINPLLSEREVQFYLSNSGARILFGSEQFAAAGVAGAQAANARHWLVDDCSLAALTEGLTPHPRPVVLPDDATAVILHTSGTTGTPKGAELTHGGLNRNQAITARRLLQIGHSDVVMGCLPLFHVFGMTCGLNEAVSSGATLTLIPRFDPQKALAVIERDRVTVFEGVPTMYSALLNAADGSPSDTGSLRTCASGGASLMKGYWRLPEKTAAAIVDGWFASGDIGRVDEDGFYFIVDRKKELIIRGGFNVYPREVEEVLYEHPAIAEAAVIGIAHELLGEEIGGAVVLKNGATATAAEVIAFVKDRIAAYKYPRQVWFVEELPKGATGKVLRRKVQAPQKENAS